jgi:DNA-binding transcriptional MerR regulator
LLLYERNAENDYRIYGVESVKTPREIQLMKYPDFSLDQIADGFIEYIQQVCRSVRESLEIGRRDFIAFLEQFRDEQGQYTFERHIFVLL